MNDLKDNAAAGRFEILEGGHVVFADYRRAEGRLYIDHVETPVALRCAGAAGRLMAAIADQARQEGLTIVPVCPYARNWLHRHRHPSPSASAPK